MDKELWLDKARKTEREWDNELRREWRNVQDLTPFALIINMLEVEATGKLNQMATVPADAVASIASLQGETRGLRRAIDILLEAGQTEETLENDDE